MPGETSERLRATPVCNVHPALRQVPSWALHTHNSLPHPNFTVTSDSGAVPPLCYR